MEEKENGRGNRRARGLFASTASSRAKRYGKKASEQDGMANNWMCTVARTKNDNNIKKKKKKKKKKQSRAVSREQTESDEQCMDTAVAVTPLPTRALTTGRAESTGIKPTSAAHSTIVSTVADPSIASHSSGSSPSSSSSSSTSDIADAQPLPHSLRVMRLSPGETGSRKTATFSHASFLKDGPMRLTPKIKARQNVVRSLRGNESRLSNYVLPGSKSTGKLGRISGPAKRLASSKRGTKHRKTPRSYDISSSPRLLGRKLGDALAKAAHQNPGQRVTSPRSSSSFSHAVQTPSGRKILAKNLTAAMTRLTMAPLVNEGDNELVDKPDELSSEVMLHSRTFNPNSCDVDTEVRTLTATQPHQERTSAFSRPRCSSPGLPRQRSHDALAQTLTVQSDKVEALTSIRAFCGNLDKTTSSKMPINRDSPGPRVRSANSSFGDIFGVFEDDDSDSEYLPPRLSFSADETAPFATHPNAVRGSPSYTRGIQ